MLKSEFCQLTSLAVPQLLHALSLSHGADIFWNLINSNFNNKDWKIRFEAGQRQTQTSHLLCPLNLIQYKMQCLSDKHSNIMQNIIIGSNYIILLSFVSMNH